MDLHMCGNLMVNVLTTLYLYDHSNNASKIIFNKSASQRAIEVTVKTIHRRFERAKYILCVHINTNRKVLCRIRLSS